MQGTKTLAFKPWTWRNNSCKHWALWIVSNTSRRPKALDRMGWDHKRHRVNKNRPSDEAVSEGVQVRPPWEQLSPAPMEQKLDVYFRSEVRVLFCLQDARAEGPLETSIQSPSGDHKVPLILEVRLVECKAQPWMSRVLLGPPEHLVGTRLHIHG